MTRFAAKKLWPILRAYANGAQIEWGVSLQGKEPSSWYPCDEKESFFMNRQDEPTQYVYRIVKKPKEKKECITP